MIFDAIIIGGSFAGLSAAIQLARGRRSVCVIDAGQPRNRFASHSHGFFAHDGDAPRVLIGAGREKVAAYPNVTFIDAQATGTRGQNEDFTVTAGGQDIQGRKLILAFGIRDNLPDMRGLKERWGHSVLHCPYCHGYEFQGQPLGVLSLTPMSAHQALMIPEWGPTTFFLNGGEMPDSQTRARLQQRHVIIEPARISGFVGAAPDMAGVMLEDGRTVPITALYLGSRTELNSPIAGVLGCALQDGMFGPVIQIDGMGQTSVPGVYAAGDIARSAHNATWATSDGVMAGSAAHRSLIFDPLGMTF
ncbi:hypothetical protein MMA231_03624 (plasmid) [Asticcacaulis sp. MM231]|uniref:NAD(P)/FAD-dependent oxidoreductase n=1 Tax=Asticcacaulis sp. MM231 TaxID=3157666 RepID=UPI0032D5A674